MTRLNKAKPGQTRMLYFSGLLVLVFLTVTEPVYGQDIFNAENSFNFGKYLYTSGQFELAINEFERASFLKPGQDSTAYFLLASYRKAGQIEKGFQKSFHLGKDFKQTPAFLAKEYGRILIAAQQFEQAHEFLAKSKEPDLFSKIGMRICAAVLEEKYRLADSLSKLLAGGQEIKMKLLYTLSEEGINLRHKSPWIAGIMSALVPGLGKIYSHDIKDALASQILILGSGYLAYRGFYRKGPDSVFGWVYSGIAAGLYAGNIAGSVRAVKKFNTREKERVHEKARILLEDF